MDPGNQIDLAGYIERHADTIGVRVEIDGKWQDRYLSELPARLAISEAFRLLFRGCIPVRVIKGDERNISAMLNAPDRLGT